MDVPTCIAAWPSFATWADSGGRPDLMRAEARVESHRGPVGMQPTRDALEEVSTMRATMHCDELSYRQALLYLGV